MKKLLFLSMLLCLILVACEDEIEVIEEEEYTEDIITITTGEYGEMTFRTTEDGIQMTCVTMVYPFTLRLSVTGGFGEEPGDYVDFEINDIDDWFDVWEGYEDQCCVYHVSFGYPLAILDENGDAGTVNSDEELAAEICWTDFDDHLGETTTIGSDSLSYTFTTQVNGVEVECFTMHYPFEIFISVDEGDGCVEYYSHHIAGAPEWSHMLTYYEGEENNLCLGFLFPMDIVMEDGETKTLYSMVEWYDEVALCL